LGVTPTVLLVPVRSHCVPVQIVCASVGAHELALDHGSRWTVILVIRIGGAFLLFIDRIIGRDRYRGPELRNGEGFRFEVTRYPVGLGACHLIAL
jgi:hypothetical protein